MSELITTRNNITKKIVKVVKFGVPYTCGPIYDRAQDLRP